MSRKFNVEGVKSVINKCPEGHLLVGEERLGFYGGPALRCDGCEKYFCPKCGAEINYLATEYCECSNEAKEIAFAMAGADARREQEKKDELRKKIKYIFFFSLMSLFVLTSGVFVKIRLGINSLIILGLGLGIAGEIIFLIKLAIRVDKYDHFMRMVEKLRKNNR